MDGTIRLGAACALTVACGWGGRMLAAAQGRRAQALSGLHAGVKRLAAEMLERRLPLQEALSACGEELFAAVARGLAAGNSPSAACAAAMGALGTRGQALDALDEGDVAALQRLFDRLGEGNVTVQRLLLEEAAEELQRLHGQARRRREEQGKLYASLGALTGLALALMLL